MFDPRSVHLSQAGVRLYGGAVLGCFLIVWVISVAWWALLPDARVIALEVPAGTAAAIMRGDDVSVIPDSLALRQGDTLAVRNYDEVVHRIGETWLPPERTTRIPVTRDLLTGASLICSIHPSGAVGVYTLARPTILATAIPTVLAGVPASVALLVALVLARGLEERESNAAVI